MRQFTRHLEEFFGGLSTAPCVWQSRLRSTGTPFFLESTSGNAVLSASWFDSGHTFTYSSCTFHPAVTCWVLVAVRVQYLDFLGDDGCYGLLVAGLWVLTTTLHRGRPVHSTLSAIRRNLWYGLGFYFC